jgi:hypothetical protein
MNRASINKLCMYTYIYICNYIIYVIIFIIYIY